MLWPFRYSEDAASFRPTLRHSSLYVLVKFCSAEEFAWCCISIPALRTIWSLYEAMVTWANMPTRSDLRRRKSVEHAALPRVCYSTLLLCSSSNCLANADYFRRHVGIPQVQIIALFHSLPYHWPPHHTTLILRRPANLTSKETCVRLQPYSYKCDPADTDASLAAHLFWETSSSV